MIYECELPFPPSQNHMHKSARVKGGKTVRYNSANYNAWTKAAPELILPKCGSIDFPVHVSYALYFPTEHKQRDIDNYIKVPQDYLVKQGVLFEDNRTIVSSIAIRFAGIDKGNPRVEIAIHELKDNVVVI